MSAASTASPLAAADSDPLSLLPEEGSLQIPQDVPQAALLSASNTATPAASPMAGEAGGEVEEEGKQGSAITSPTQYSCASPPVVPMPHTTPGPRPVVDDPDGHVVNSGVPAALLVDASTSLATLEDVNGWGADLTISRPLSRAHSRSSSILMRHDSYATLGSLASTTASVLPRDRDSDVYQVRRNIRVGGGFGNASAAAVRATSPHTHRRSAGGGPQRHRQSGRRQQPHPSKRTTSHSSSNSNNNSTGSSRMSTVNMATMSLAQRQHVSAALLVGDSPGALLEPTLEGTSVSGGDDGEAEGSVHSTSDRTHQQHSSKVTLQLSLRERRDANVSRQRLVHRGSALSSPGGSIAASRSGSPPPPDSAAAGDRHNLRSAGRRPRAAEEAGDGAGAHKLFPRPRRAPLVTQYTPTASARGPVMPVVMPAPGLEHPSPPPGSARESRVHNIRMAMAEKHERNALDAPCNAPHPVTLSVNLAFSRQVCFAKSIFTSKW